MKEESRIRIERILKRIPMLTEGQLVWLDRVIQVFESPHEFTNLGSDLLDDIAINNFGDAIRIHHSFSAEPFSKDKFEYVLQKILNLSKCKAFLAPKGNRGHDIIVNGIPISLKTQADKNISNDKIWISKFMELGKGQWTDKPKDFIRLRDLFLTHLRGYKRIFVLRALTRVTQWHYELVEIPMQLMESAKMGELEIKTDSKQFPKPGYYHVYDQDNKKIYELYFDAGSERKLQVKNLLKSHCIVHAEWKFVIPEE